MKTNWPAFFSKQTRGGGGGGGAAPAAEDSRGTPAQTGPLTRRQGPRLEALGDGLVSPGRRGAPSNMGLLPSFKPNTDAQARLDTETGHARRAQPLGFGSPNRS